MARGNDNLVDSKDPARWQAALDSYPERVKQHAQTGKRRKSLVSLDEFVRTHLPVVIKARYSDASDDKGYLKKEDVCKIVEWKITASLPTLGCYCMLICGLNSVVNSGWKTHSR